MLVAGRLEVVTEVDAVVAAFAVGGTPILDAPQTPQNSDARSFSSVHWAQVQTEGVTDMFVAAVVAVDRRRSADDSASEVDGCCLRAAGFSSSL